MKIVMLIVGLFVGSYDINGNVLLYNKQIQRL